MINSLDTYPSLDVWLELITAGLVPLRSLRPGDRLQVTEWFADRYQVEAYLGVGRTAVAVLATDVVIDRPVVLKVSAPRRRFLSHEYIYREARILGQIAHSGVVTLYDFGEHPFPWLALEYLGAVTIRSELYRRSGPVRWSVDISHLLRQIALIVEYLHYHAKVFQIDLKPDNLALIGSDNHVKMMDLGSGISSRQTSILRYGTPGYIAPELLESYAPSAASDMFSLGVLYYEIICGANPFTSAQSFLAPERNWYDVPVSTALPDPDDLKRSEAEGLKRLKDTVVAFDPTPSLSAANAPHTVIEMISNLIAVEPLKRPSADSVRVQLDTIGDDSSSTVLRPRIFISHSRHDSDTFVLPFAEALRRNGVDVWLDQWNLRGGDAFWESIGSAIQSSDFIIVILSENSITSEGVAEELRLAHLLNLGLSPRILPIRIDPIHFSRIPVTLRARHVLDFVQWKDPEAYPGMLAKLVADIHSHLESRRLTPSAPDGVM